MSSEVAELESLLADQPKNPLRPEQRRGYEEELERLGAIAQAPPHVGGDRGEAVKRYRQIKGLVDAQSPKPLGERASRVHALVQSIRANTIQPAMLPQNVMRRNPAGAVDAFMKRENSRPVKRAILAVKRAMFALDPETDDRDHANLEKYRPSGINPDGTSTWSADAQIPGFLAMSPQAKENWPLGEPKVTTPLAQAQARDTAEAPAKPTRKPMSEAQKQAARERLAKGRATAQANREAKAVAQ